MVHIHKNHTNQVARSHGRLHMPTRTASESRRTLQGHTVTSQIRSGHGTHTQKPHKPGHQFTRTMSQVHTDSHQLPTYITSPHSHSTGPYGPMFTYPPKNTKNTQSSSAGRMGHTWTKHPYNPQRYPKPRVLVGQRQYRSNALQISCPMSCTPRTPCRLPVSVDNASEKGVSETSPIYGLGDTARCHLESSGKQFPASVSRPPEMTFPDFSPSIPYTPLPKDSK